MLPIGTADLSREDAQKVSSYPNDSYTVPNYYSQESPPHHELHQARHQGHEYAPSSYPPQSSALHARRSSRTRQPIGSHLNIGRLSQREILSPNDNTTPHVLSTAHCPRHSNYSRSNTLAPQTLQTCPRKGTPTFDDMYIRKVIREPMQGHSPNHSSYGFFKAAIDFRTVEAQVQTRSTMSSSGQVHAQT